MRAAAVASKGNPHHLRSAAQKANDKAVEQVVEKQKATRKKTQSRRKETVGRDDQGERGGAEREQTPVDEMVRLQNKWDVLQEMLQTANRMEAVQAAKKANAEMIPARSHDQAPGGSKDGRREDREHSKQPSQANDGRMVRADSRLEGDASRAQDGRSGRAGPVRSEVSRRELSVSRRDGENRLQAIPVPSHSVTNSRRVRRRDDDQEESSESRPYQKQKQTTVKGQNQPVGRRNAAEAPIAGMGAHQGRWSTGSLRKLVDCRIAEADG